LANKIILLIYGVEYIPSIIALQILIWTIVFMFINGLYGNLFASIDRQITVTRVTGIGVIVNIGLSFIIIPKFSYIGQALQLSLQSLQFY